MIDLEFLERLIHTLDASGIDHVEIERGGHAVTHHER
jgi:predicted Ser/Thr protein kinase